MPLLLGAFLKEKTARTLSINPVTKELCKQWATVENYNFIIQSGVRNEESSAEKLKVFTHTTGMLIGRLFEKGSSVLKENLEEWELEKIRESQGRWLSERYWGRYLVILLDEESITIYRDPLGGIPLFITQTAQGVVFSTELSMLYDALEEKPVLDWTYFTSYVAADFLTTVTPFKGIEEVFPGSYVSITAEGYKTGLFWDPTQIGVKEEKELEEQILETFSSCIKAWTQETEGIALELSGGLDSSALLILLKQVAPTLPITCFNYFHSRVASSDERNYATQVAQECDAELHCIDLSEHISLSMLPQLRASKPHPLLLEEAMCKHTAALVAQKNCEFMSGHGGDHLFLAPPLVESLADYFFIRGTRGISSKISEIAAYYRMSLIQVIKDTGMEIMRYYTSHKRHLLASLEREHWMNSAFMEQVKNDTLFLHDNTKIYPGKLSHIVSLYDALVTVDKVQRIPGKSVINPFLFQPLVELALSIPTYQLYKQEHDRFPFRNAISRISKAPNIWRKDKGDTTAVTIYAFNVQYKQICELLFEGKFVQHNLIDKDKLYTYINQWCHSSPVNIGPLINLLSTELWFKTWNIS